MKKLPFLILLFTTSLLFAQEEKKETTSQEPLSEELSLEDLMNVQVTSVSKSSEKLQDVAASLYVITQDDIKRMGATRIQDILATVPGAFFNIDNYMTAEFGMREDANAFLGTVLVLVDNVPYQSPYSSAFDFSNFDIDFDNIDRIEVIKGPGGAIYGANAATGVISIFTKKSKDTQGAKVSMMVGSRGLISPTVSYGAKIGENTYITTNVKTHFFSGYRPLDEFNGNYVTVPFSAPDGTYLHDTIIANKLTDNVYKSSRISGGMGLQSKINDKLSLSSNFLFSNSKYDSYFPGILGTTVLNRNNFNRLVSTVRLDYNPTEKQSIFIQASNTFESNSNGNTNINTNQSNLEIQDNITLFENHSLALGVNLREVNFQVKGSPAVGVAYDDPNASEHLYGFFAQYKLPIGKKIDFIVGAKAEQWTLINKKFQISPSGRLSVRPTKSLTIWAAGSRSVTTPGFIQTNLDLTLVPANLYPIDTLGHMNPRMALVNAPEMHPTVYNTGELGIKIGGKTFSAELSGFYSMVDDAIGVAAAGNLFDTTTWVYSPIDINQTAKIVPYYYSNVYKSENMGGELLLKIKPMDMLSLELSYAYFDKTTKGKDVTFEYESGKVINLTVSDPKPENPSTAQNVVRLKLNFNFGSGVYLSLQNQYSTKAGSNSYLYYTQSAPGIGSTVSGYELDPVHNIYKLNFKLEKRFNDEKSSVYIFGNDVTNTGTIENFNSYQTAIPYQTHGIYGVGAIVKF